MADDAGSREHKYWYALAVFRDERDADSSLSRLCAGMFKKENVLMLDQRSLPSNLDGGTKALSPALKSFLRALCGNGAGEQSAGDERGQARIYSHLLRDVAAGAVVLVASAAGAEQQLEGARVLLRGNSECVVTHEIVDSTHNAG